MNLKTAYNSFVKYAGNIKQALASGQSEYGALRMGKNAVGLSLKDAGISKLSLGVGAVTTALTVGYAAWNAWKKSVEEARQRADDAGESLKSTASNIDEYKTKIAELKTSISSGSLSKDEEYNAKVQLLSIQDELIEKYGSEAEQLNILTSSSDAYCASLDNITQAEARANLRDNGKEYDKAIDEMTKEREFKINLGGIEDTDKALEILKDTLSENSNISLSDAWGGVKELSITGNAQDVQAALESLYDTLEQSNAEGHYFDSLKQMISGDLSQVDDVVSEFNSRYEAAIETRIMSGYDNGISAKAADNIDAYIAAIRDSIANGDFGAAQKNWNLLTADNLLDGVKDKDIRQYLQDKIDEATSGDFETQIKLGLDFGSDTDIKRQVLNALDTFIGSDGIIDTSMLLSMDNGGSSGATENQVAAYNSLTGVADKYGMTVSELVTYLTSLGAIQTSVTDTVSNASLAASEAQKSVESLASAYSTLATAMKETQNGGLSSDTALDIMSQLETAGENYTDYLSVENGKLKLNTAAWIKYANEKNKIKLDDLKAQRDAQQESLDSMSQGENEDSSVYTKRYTDAFNALNDLNGQIEIYEALVNDATSATDMFFGAYSAGESKMSAISDIIESLNTGGATQSQALEWIKQIPELADYYDASSNTFFNMNEALTSITESDVNSYLSDTAAYLKENADMSDESKTALLGLADAYKTMAANTLTTGKAWGVLNKNVTSAQKPFKQLQTQVKNLWNSDVFADARSDLVSLAKKTGITSSDIMDLAKDNIYLQAMLSETGVSAQYLAKIFENLSLYGNSAFNSITDDAIRVNAVLSEMEGPLQKVSLAYEKYKSTLGTWEYDDSFDNFQEAYKNLGEMFKNGEYGADFYRTIDYLYGEGHGADGIESLYAQYKKLGQVFSKDDNGLGFLQKLYAEQSKFGGDFVKLDSNGKYIWNIGPEDFAGIAEGLGMTEDEVAACVEALGMFGDFTEYDPSKLVDTFKDLNMVLTDTEGNTIANEEAVRDLLKSLGKEPWQIDQIISKLKESNEIKLFDAADSDDVTDTLNDLQELGKLRIDGDKIGLNSLTAALRSLGMSDGEIETFMKTLDELGYHFTDPTGKALELNEAVSQIDGTPLEDLKSAAEKAQDALNKTHGLNLDIDFGNEDIDYLDNEFERLNKMRNTLVNKDGTIKIGMEDSYEQISAMMYALLRQKDSLQQPFIMSVDTANADGEIYEFISNLQQLYSLTQEKYSIEVVGGDTSGLQSEIDSTIANIQSTSPEILASFGINEASSDSEIYASIGRIKDQASLEKIMLDAGVDKTEVEAFMGESHDTTSSTYYRVDPNSQVYTWTPPTKYGKIIYTTTGDTSGTSAKVGSRGQGAVVNGSAHASGTAHASGAWRTKKTETALTGELDRELIVDPDSGTWYTVGDNGAQFTNVPKGSIVFNHKQTESLLKYGKVAGRGRAYAGGSTPTVNPATGKKYPSSYTGSGSTNKSSSSSGSGSADDFSEQLDWIETLIDRIERKITRLSNTAGSAFQKLSTRLGAVYDEMSEITQEIEYQRQAYDAYMAEADANPLPEYYKELVRNGDIYLEEITNEDLNEYISKYKEMYEKALDASDKIAELEENHRQLYQDAFDITASHYDAASSFNSDEKEYLQDFLLKTLSDGGINQDSSYTRWLNAQAAQIDALKQERLDLVQKLKDAVDSGEIEEYSEEWYEMQSTIQAVQQSIAEFYKDSFDATSDRLDAVIEYAESRSSYLQEFMLRISSNGQYQNGDSYKQWLKVQNSQLAALEEKQSELETNLANAVASGEIKEYSKSWYEMQAAIQAVQQAIAELYQTRFDSASNRFDAILGSVESKYSLLEEYVSQIEDNGHIVNEKFYEIMIDDKRETLGLLVKKKSDLIDELNAALDSGKIQKYSSAWYAMQKTIDDVDKSIAEVTGDIDELNRTIRQMHWDEFDDARSTIDGLNDEADFLIDAMSRGDKLFDDNGNMTDRGLATMGLRVQKYATYMDQVRAYGEEISNIDAQLADDPYNTDLINRRKELVEAQREAAKGALDEKDALADLVKDGIEKQLDAMSKLIDKYKEALDAAKDAYDYQKRIKEQTKEIASLEKQIASYGGDNSEEAKATIQKLKVSLEDAKSDLEETQYDQYVSDQKEMLDELYDSYEEILNKRLDDLDLLLEDCINVVNENGSSIMKILNGEAGSLGVTISDPLKSIWESFESPKDYSDGINGIHGIVGAISATLSQIEADIQRRYSENAANGIIAQMEKNSEAWFTADKSTRDALHQQNVALAGQLSAITGQTTYSSNGRWYDKDGNPLYEIDKDSVAKDIVSKMKENAAAWADSSDSKRKELSDENMRLGNSLKSLLGENVYRGKDGVWYIGNRRLFDVYHSGGIVGGGDHSDNERLAVLLNHEAVLTSDQLSDVSDTMSAYSKIIKDIGDIQIPNPAAYISDAFKDITPVSASGASTVQNNNNSFDISFTLPNVKSYEEFMNAITGDSKFEKFLQSVTIDRVAGKSKLSKEKYRW